MDFAAPAGHEVKIKESEKRDKYLDLARELKKLWNMKVTVISITVDVLGTILKRFVQETGRLGNRRTSKDDTDYSIIKIGQYTEKSPADLLSLKLHWETS